MTIATKEKKKHDYLLVKTNKVYNSKRREREKEGEKTLDILNNQ